MVKKYGLNMLIPSDDGLRVYLTKITEQLSRALAFPKPIYSDRDGA
jgi:hypothetical protein